MEGMDEPCKEWGSKPRGDLEQGSGTFREGQRGRGVSEELGSPVLGCLWLGPTEREAVRLTLACGAGPLSLQGLLEGTKCDGGVAPPKVRGLWDPQRRL